VAEKSTNFSFLLDGHEPTLHRIALGAERAFVADPNTTVMKCRQLAEAFAQHAAAAVGVWAGPNMAFVDVVRALEGKRIVEGDAALLFRHLRVAGNAATHGFSESHRLALDQLRFAHKLAIWFHRSFGPIRVRDSFKPAPFSAPEDPSANLRALEDDARRARAEAESHKAEASAARAALAAEEVRRQEAERVAALAEAERAEWERFAAELDRLQQAEMQALQQAHAALQARAATDVEAQKQTVALALAATAKIELDENDTRTLIDAQIRAAGWEVDSRSLRYASGARPEIGKNQVIAEWPISSGRADYMFFIGLTPVAVAEAKKIGKAIVSDLGQSKRYSRDYIVRGEERPPGPAHGYEASFAGWPTATGSTAQNGVLTSADAQALTGLDASAVRPLLEKLVELGLAKRTGQARGTKYVWQG
jgi:type I restriction enzyme R subunit